MWVNPVVERPRDWCYLRLGVPQAVGGRIWMLSNKIVSYSDQWRRCEREQRVGPVLLVASGDKVGMRDGNFLKIFHNDVMQYFAIAYENKLTH